jgi:hypothetical protein
LNGLLQAVAHDLSYRYCPYSKTVFATKSLVLAAFFAAVALVVFVAARRRSKTGSGAYSLYVMAGAVLLFAIGSGALVLYGLGGCSGPPAEGLIWDWP